MTVLSWVRIVEDVSLVGDHPKWPGSKYGDALVIQFGSPFGQTMQEYMKAQKGEWGKAERLGHRREDDLFTLKVAPDWITKAGYSGGEPYGFLLPDASVEGIFSWREYDMPFVSYLNLVFEHGGFPVEATPEVWEDVIADLAAGLLPL